MQEESKKENMAVVDWRLWRHEGVVCWEYDFADPCHIRLRTLGKRGTKVVEFNLAKDYTPIKVTGLQLNCVFKTC